MPARNKEELELIRAIDFITNRLEIGAIGIKNKQCDNIVIGFTNNHQGVSATNLERIKTFIAEYQNYPECDIKIIVYCKDGYNLISHLEYVGTETDEVIFA